MADAAVYVDQKSHTLAYLLIEASVIVGVPLLCSFANIGEDTTKNLTTFAALIPPYYGYWSAKRRRDPVQEVDALSRGVISRPFVLIVLILAVSLLAVDRIISGMMGFLAGSMIENLGGGEMEMWVAYGYLSFGVTVPCILAASFLMSRHAGYYLGAKPVQGTMAAIVLYTVMSVLIAALSGFPLDIILISNLVALPVLLGLAAFGAQSSKRRQARYAASKLFANLGSDDQRAALALLGEVTNEAVRKT